MTVFILILKSDVDDFSTRKRNEILNASTSATIADLPIKSLQGADYYLIESTKENAFNSPLRFHEFFNSQQIKSILTGAPFTVSKVLKTEDREGKQEFRTSNVATDDHYRVRHRGIFDLSVVAQDQNGIQDWKVPQLQYLGVDVPSVMTGVKYKVIGGNDSDTIDFYVGDKDGVGVALGLYDQATFEFLLAAYGGFIPLDDFSLNYYIFKDEKAEIREHTADLIPGLYIRAHIKNNGQSDLRFLCNILRYINTAG